MRWLAAPLDPLEVNQFRIALVQIVDDTAANVTELEHQRLHGEIGFVSGSEQFLGPANGLDMMNEFRADPFPSMVWMDIEHGDEALGVEGILKDNVVHDFPVQNRNIR